MSGIWPHLQNMWDESEHKPDTIFPGSEVHTWMEKIERFKVIRVTLLTVHLTDSVERFICEQLLAALFI